jgi:hypothetical protein
MIDWENWQKRYYRAENWGEADRLIEELSDVELEEFIDSHDKVKKFTGLDMRQSFILTTARCTLQNRRQKK